MSTHSKRWTCSFREHARADATVQFIPDGAIRCDASGTIDFVGNAAELPSARPPLASSRKSSGIILPPFLDAHIHIPQNPIRGHFMDGITAHPPEGRLI